MSVFRLKHANEFEFCFFKQKTAFEVLSGLVGSEGCIRASVYVLAP